MNDLSHIKTNSLAAAQVHCYRGMSGSLIGGIDGLRIQPTGNANALSARLSWENGSKGMPAFGTELSENKLASRIT
ncbi:MAG: hypothetical protein ACSHYB_16900 [Roseibacillus sp.]